MRRFLVLGVIWAAWLATAARGQEDETRVWTSRVGSKVVGSFAGYENGVVKIKAANGKVGSIPLRSLSAADHRYVKSQLPADEAEKFPEPEPERKPKKKSRWPPGTGYVSGAQNKPDRPLPLGEVPRAGRTEAKIVEVNHGIPKLKGFIETYFKDGAHRQMHLHPGARLVNVSKDRKAVTIMDYNKDRCTIPYGMMVRVDEYGQFVPFARIKRK